MFSKFRRVLVLLLTSSAVFLCIICTKNSFWHPVKPMVFLANQSSTTRRNGYISGSETTGSRGVLLAAESARLREVSSIHLGKRKSEESTISIGINKSSLLFERKPPDFSKLQTLLLFIGYPRSGSTLFGSLLDAHPHILIANEYNLLGKWKNLTHKHKNRDYIFMELWKNSVSEAVSKQRAAHSKFFFSYFVPGLWQGSYRDHIKIIGDKRCTSTTRGLSSNSTRFADLSSTLNLPIKFIHIIRNPFDNIATMTLRSGAQWLRMKAEQKSLRVNAPRILHRQTQVYLNLVDMNAKLRKKFGNRVLDVDYSSFIREPKVWWKKICLFLEIHCSEHYVDSIANIVFKKETYTRRHIHWLDSVKEKIIKKINTVSFLKDMKFEIS